MWSSFVLAFLDTWMLGYILALYWGAPLIRLFQAFVFVLNTLSIDSFSFSWRLVLHTPATLGVIIFHFLSWLCFTYPRRSHKGSSCAGWPYFTYPRHRRVLYDWTFCIISNLSHTLSIRVSNLVTNWRQKARCRRHAATLFRITASDILRIRRFSGLSSGLFMFRFL